MLRLEYDLPTGAARRAHISRELAIRAPCSYGKAHHGPVGIVGAGIEKHRALGTEPRGIGGILLVAAMQDGAVVQHHASTD